MSAIEDTRRFSKEILGEAPSEEHREKSKALYEQGKTIWAAGEHMEAIHYYDTAIFLTPDDPDLYFCRAQAKQSLNLCDEAQKDLNEQRRLLNRNPTRG